jgi:hypothetical protein
VVVPEGRKPRLPGLKPSKARTVSFDLFVKKMQTIFDGLDIKVA